MKKTYWLLSLVLVLASAPPVAFADGSEVVVVYNKKSPESKAVAEYYARMRQVPSKQVYGLPLPTTEIMSRADFTDLLQRPLAKRLEADGLWKVGKVSALTNLPGSDGRRVITSKIRYLVLCYGVPLRIAEDPGLRENIPADYPGAFRRNAAAVDSELTVLPLLGAGLPAFGPLQNWVYATTNNAALNPTNGILLVARLDGPTAEVARGLVDKALAAERDGLWGRAYFDARGLPATETNYIVGDELILMMARTAKILGYETVIDDNPGTFRRDFPMSQIALYAGWYDQDVSGPFRLPKVEFMPGAFAYHLHSFSAATIRNTTNDWVGPLLAKGATCTMGCVDEPSLQFTPNIAVFFERWTLSACTFGEAAWSAQVGLSWQTTVVGDPLYRPFARSPEQLHAHLAGDNNPLIAWSFLRMINGFQLRGQPLSQLIGSLENLPTTQHSAVLTEKLASLCDAAGKPSSALALYQKALELDPSPQQRIRLHLTIADKFTADGQKRETYDELRKIFVENPDYMDKFEVLKRMLDLAIALGDKDEITRCVKEMQDNPPKPD